VNKLFLIAQIRIKILLRRKSLLILCIILPIVFYSFIGKVFKESDSYDKVPIALVDEDKSESSSIIIKNLKKNDILNCKVVEKKEALKLVTNNKVEGVFLFTKGLEENIKKESFKDIVQVYHLPDNSLVSALSDVVAGEMLPLVCTSQAANTSEFLFKKHNSSKKTVIKEEAIAFGKEAMKDASYNLPIEITALTPDMKEVSLKAFRRSVIPKQSALGMFLIFTTLYLFLNCTSLMKEKACKVYNRLRISGCSLLHLLLGDLLGIFIVGMALQIIQLPLLYILFKGSGLSKFMYILIINSLYIFCIGNLLIVLTKIFKNTTALQSFMPIFVFLIGLIGGCLWNVELLPKNFHIFSMMMPTYWAQSSLTNLILYNHSFSTILNSLIFLFVEGCIFFIISYILERNSSRL